ncbi:MAG: hypothetical protein ACKOAH_10455, partial [Pirellula sp.]
VNTVNLVNTVNAVKYTPPPGGVSTATKETSACGGREWVWTVLTLLTGLTGLTADIVDEIDLIG